MNTRGNIYVMLFAAVGMAGVVGVAVQQNLMSPLKSASTVTKKNSSETQMQLGIRVVATNAVTQQATGGDCDADGMVEPLPYVDAGVAAHPTGGGYLPANSGGVKYDPWSTQYGYCVWDHGSAVDDAGCGGASQLRLPGTSGSQWESVAIISAGPDKIFQTTCNAWADVNVDNVPDTPLINKAAGSDDIYYAWSYEQASVGTGSLWLLENIALDTAGIARRISVLDGSNNEQLSFDPVSKELAVGSTGRGDFPNLDVDYIQALTSPSVQLLRGLAFYPEDGSGTTFTLRNLTGDSLDLWTGAYNMLSFGASNSVRFQPTSDANKYVTLTGGATNSPVLGIYNNLTNDYAISVRLYSNVNSAATNRYGYLSGAHTADNGVRETTSAIVLGPQTGGANATDTSSYIGFYTRPTGAAVGVFPTERMRIDASGNVGIGTSAPLGRLHVVGDMSVPSISVRTTETGIPLIVQGTARLGNSGAPCDYAMLGGVRYNTGTDVHEFCDGANWTAISYTTCATPTPTAFSFTDITNAAPNTVVTSEIRQVSGIAACALPVRITGTANAEYRICTNGLACDGTVVYDWSSNINFITNGQYVQVRLTTPNKGNYKTDLALVAGERSFDWSVKTSGSCSDSNPPLGTFCNDGSIFVGYSADGGAKLYTTKCYPGQEYTGAGCYGTATQLPWSSGATVATGITSYITGESNTTTLAGLSNADSPYVAAQYCNDLNENGQTDWYLPSYNELGAVHSICPSIPGMSCSAVASVLTSSEISATQVNVVRMGETINRSYIKSTATYFRCVRKD